MKNAYLNDIIAVLLILLFVYTAASKLMDITQFRAQLMAQTFPLWFATMLLYTLPGFEISASLLLFFPQTRLAGFYASLVLMILFTAYTGLILLHFFGRVPCSCGGVIKRLGWGSHFVFNLFFLLVATAGIFTEKYERRQIGKNKR